MKPAKTISVTGAKGRGVDLRRRHQVSASERMFSAGAGSGRRDRARAVTPGRPRLPIWAPPMTPEAPITSTWRGVAIIRPMARKAVVEDLAIDHIVGV